MSDHERALDLEAIWERSEEAVADTLALIAEVRRLREELEAAETTADDEEAAHLDTLRILKLREAERDQLRAAAGKLCMWVRHTVPEWTPEVEKYLEATEAALAPPSAPTTQTEQFFAGSGGAVLRSWFSPPSSDREPGGAQ